MNKCHICNQDAIFTCRQCGKSVCGDHYSFDNGKCAECNGAWKKPAAPVLVTTITKRQKARK